MTYYIHYPDHACYLLASAPSGFGYNTANGTHLTLTGCATSNCDNCQTTSATCVKCDESGSPKYYLYTNLCYEPDNTGIPNGKGPKDNSPHALVNCNQAIECLKCRNYFDKCQECKPGPTNTEYFLHSADDDCYQRGTDHFPINKGPDLTTLGGMRTTSTCQPTNC